MSVLEPSGVVPEQERFDGGVGEEFRRLEDVIDPAPFELSHCF